MNTILISLSRLPFFIILALSFTTPLVMADVSKETETEYERNYLNRAMFLKTPIRGDRQTIFIRERNIIPDTTSAGLPLRFLVGEQVRVTDIKFRDNSIEFRVSSIDGVKNGTLVYQFPGPLEFGFPEKDNFDKALENTLTSGLSYREIEASKKGFIQEEFKRSTIQMAEATSTDQGFVMDAITTQIPEVASALRKQEQLEKELAALRSEYETIETRNNQLGAEVRELRADLARTQEESQTIRAERDQLARKESGQEQELLKLREENSRIRQQLDTLAKEMDVQIGSNTELSGQVDSLSNNLRELRKEWSSLRGKMESTEKELEKTRDERNRLNSELSLSRRKAAKLQSQLDSLTSNRDSLEATYIRTRNQLDNLELARKIGDSLSLLSVTEDSEATADMKSYAVNLLSKRIGILSVQPPAHKEAQGKATFTVESPDTVQFSEEERVMFGTLGKELRIKAEWKAVGGDLTGSLAQGEALQSVAPRQAAEWTWDFSGDPNSSAETLLEISFVDQNGHLIPVADLEFTVEPKGILPVKMKGGFWIPALIGFILGSLFVLLLMKIGSGRKPRKPGKTSSRREPAPYSTQKNL